LIARASCRIIKGRCGTHAAISAEKPRNVAAIEESAERVEHRLVRNRLIELDAAPTKDSPAAHGPLLRHPFGELGLPYACLAHKQEPSSTAGYCCIKEVGSNLPFVTPSH